MNEITVKKITEIADDYYIDKISNDLIFLKKRPVTFTATQIISYPYVKYVFPVSLIIERYKQFAKVTLKQVNTPPATWFNAPNMNRQFSFNGKRQFVNFIHPRELDYVFECLDLYFQEECRIICYRGNQTENFKEFFARRRLDIQAEALKRGDIKYDNILSCSTGLGFILCSEFHPFWASTLINFFKKLIGVKKVLDMSAGRGSRLIGAIACGVDYTGVDPNPCVFKNYQIMYEFYKRVANYEGNVKFIQNAFENLNSHILGTDYDLMFSSPPYFDLEIFASENGIDQYQSSKHKSIKDWINKFLYPSMNIIISCLRPGGIMAINIDNPRHRKIDYITPMLQFKNPKCEYLGPITISRHHTTYTTWCFLKK